MKECGIIPGFALLQSYWTKGAKNQWNICLPITNVTSCVQVRVTEDLPTGARSSEQTVQVTVLDINDNDPTFAGNGQTFNVQVVEGTYGTTGTRLTNVGFAHFLFAVNFIHSLLKVKIC